MKIFSQSLRLFLFLTGLTGIIYPLVITGLAELTMYENANGSLVSYASKPAGSLLIAQEFKSPEYFWPRPSATQYDPLHSGGSQLGPTSLHLKNKVEERLKVLMQAHSVGDSQEVPSDLIYASGSGLDPHITPRAALFQVERIAKARKLSPDEKATLEKMIKNVIERHHWGFGGPPHINVLKLNIALDELDKDLSPPKDSFKIRIR